MTIRDMIADVRERISRKPKNEQGELSFQYMLLHPFAIVDGKLKVIDITPKICDITADKIEAHTIQYGEIKPNTIKE